MNNNPNRKKKYTPFQRKLRMIWSIPIVRILAGIIAICLAFAILSSIFKGCGDITDASAVSSEETEASVSDLSTDEAVDISEQSEEVSAAPVITIPRPWVTGNVANLGEDIKSDYCIVVNRETRQVIAGKGYTQRIYPASMTKIMTLIVAAESGIALDATYDMHYTLINKFYNINATISGIKSGETVTFKDLLYAAILPSAADATEAIAIMCCGDSTEFVKKMNETARYIGCHNTNFANPSGLHDTTNYSTMADMALILDYAMQIPLCREVLSTQQYTIPPTALSKEGYTFYSTMFSRVNTYGDYDFTEFSIIGGKTGYLNESHHCLASMAVDKNGVEYIAVTSEGTGKYDPVKDCIVLYEYALSVTDGIE